MVNGALGYGSGGVLLGMPPGLMFLCILFQRVMTDKWMQVDMARSFRVFFSGGRIIVNRTHV